mgnify:FL=1
MERATVPAKLLSMELSPKPLSRMMYTPKPTMPTKPALYRQLSGHLNSLPKATVAKNENTVLMKMVAASGIGTSYKYRMPRTVAMPMATPPTRKMASPARQVPLSRSPAMKSRIPLVKAIPGR